MFILRLTTSAILLCVVSAWSWPGSLSNWIDGCNPPEQLMGKFCVIVHGLDFNMDGIIDKKDFSEGRLRFNTDDDTCSMTKAELVKGYTCEFGFTADYGRWRFRQLDKNGDEILDIKDAGSPLPQFTFDQLLNLQLTRYRDEYCNDTKNVLNARDKVMCAEANALKPEDVKC